MLSAEELRCYGVSRSSNEARGYLSVRDYGLVRRSLEGTHWWHLLHNKLISQRFYTDVVPQPVALGYLDRVNGSAWDGSRAPLRSGEELAAWCRQQGHGTFFLKHIGGGGGRLAMPVARIGAGGFHLLDGRKLTTDDVDQLLHTSAGGLTGFLVQGLVDSTEQLTELSAGGRCSFRVNTVQRPDGSAEVQFTLLRLGHPSGATDSYAQGGIYAYVDGEGTIVRAQSGDLMAPVLHRVHPRTGQPLLGVVLDGYRSVVSCALRAAEATPGLRIVALLDEGGGRVR